MKRFKFSNLKINAKLIILILATSFVIFSASIAYITIASRNIALDYSKRVTQKITKEYANKISSELNIDVGICRSLASMFENYYKIEDIDFRNNLYNELLSKTIEENPQYVSVWLNWELSAIEPGYTKKFGRDRTTYFRYNNQIEVKHNRLNLEGDDENSLYYQIKTNKKEIVTDPYFDSYTKKKEDEVLVTSICIPILRNNDFAGVIGVDVLLDRYQSMVEGLRPFDNSFAYMVTNNGTFVAHANQTMIGRSMFDNIADPAEKERYKTLVEQGTEITFVRPNSDIGKTFVSYAPIIIGESKKPWSIALTVPVKRIMDRANQSLGISILTGIAGLLFLALIVWVIARSISKPILETTNSLIDIAGKGVGEGTHLLQVKSKDEIGRMNDAVNRLVDSLRTTADFAKQIGQGKLNVEFNPLSKDDILGQSLIEMRESLKKAKAEEEERKKEDSKRYWINNGLNKFSEILRKDHGDMEKLSYNIILNLVKYLDATQGGIFILNDDDSDKFLELTACYAYDRQKFISKEVRMGEGLVGTCYMEKKMIYLEEIPENYISVSSGLGETHPKALLIVPLILNEEIFGIVEIASLKPIDDYKKDFVQEVGESVASVISTVKTNIRTAQLLQQSQQQSEEMKAQEEEMRQNMEELHATQEEMARKNAEIEGVMSGLNNSLAILELDMDETINHGNDNFYGITGLSYADVHGKRHENLIKEKYIKDGTYSELWRKLKDGRTYSVIFEYELPNRSLWTRETFAPIQNSVGMLDRVMGFIVDITEQKELEIENHAQLEEAKIKEEELRTNMEELSEAQNEMIRNEKEVTALKEALQNTVYITEYDVSGKILEINDAYLRKIKASKDEIIGEHFLYNTDLNDVQKDQLNKIWNTVLKGDSIENVINQYKAEDGKTFWVKETYTPVMDKEDKVAKVIKLGIDITGQKQAERKIKKMLNKDDES